MLRTTVKNIGPSCVPLELVVAEPALFGTALVRATGSPAYVEGLENMVLSVVTARQGWATAGQIVNARPLRSIIGARR